MPRRARSEPWSVFALVVLSVGAPLLPVAFWWGGRVGTTLAALLVGLLPAALLVLGVGPKARRLRRRVGWWIVPAALSGGVLTVYLTASEGLAEVWILGFPLPTALLIYGVGLGLLIATGWLYAASFDRLGIDQEDLDRLDRIGKRFEEGSS